MSHPIERLRPYCRFASVILAAALLGGCAGSGLELPLSAAAEPNATGGPVETGSLPPASPAVAEATAGQSPAIAEARRLRATGDMAAAMHSLETAAKAAPADNDIARERGLLALETGRIAEARRLLTKADDPKAPDWRIKSALGSALAASGDHKAAERQFQAALKLAPEHPAILNNMALSHALAGRHGEAERLLRRAVAGRGESQGEHGDRARQNLALILGLNGNIDEARRVSEATLPKDMAAANVSYLEQLRASGSKVSRVETRPKDDASATTVGALDTQN